MHLKRAMEILDVEYGAELAEIKKKYRKLMTKYHPDAIGSDLPEHRKTAQEINEAYSNIQAQYSKIRKTMPKKKLWNAKVNKQAFTERTIYMPYTMEHDVKDLYLSEQEWENIRFPYQIKLFHWLMHQYISPYECISKLWSPDSIDDKRLNQAPGSIVSFYQRVDCGQRTILYYP